MGAIFASNVLVDRYLIDIQTNAPTTADGGGVLRPMSALFDRIVKNYWIKPAGAGYYLQFRATRGHRVRVFGLLGYANGALSSNTFTVRIRTAAGLVGGATLATYSFVHDLTGAQYGDMCDPFFVLPPAALQGTPLYYTIEFPSIASSWWRVFAGDYVDVSDVFAGGWNDRLMSDPNIAQSSAPGGSYTPSPAVFGYRRTRTFGAKFSPCTMLQAFGDTLIPSAGLAMGTSLNSIYACAGTTGEVLLLPRTSVDRTAPYMTATDVESMRALGVYGHITRPPQIEFVGGDVLNRQGKAGQFWNSSIDVASLSRLFL